MLFNSFEFIFFFLPIVFFTWLFLRKYRFYRFAILSLLLFSLIFYAYWNPPFVLLLLFSIIINFFIQKSIFHLQRLSYSKLSQCILTLGIIFNISLIGYFKYKNFFLYNINLFIGYSIPNTQMFLPLGISFFTFQQIACLVDTYKEKLKEISFYKYALFVSFFPQLIAGPIVKYEEMIPQIQKSSTCRLINFDMIHLGLSLFACGLFKKIVIADYFSPISIMLFDSHVLPTFYDSILGTLAYTMQIYFDFSGYSDMALGLGALFGITLPQNFNSPYQSLSVIDFWRRWHITLSKFLKDYIYIPLGGNRRSPLRKYFNLILTMLIGGLWHGAGWNFVIWGGLHGAYLVINNIYRIHNKFIKLPNIIYGVLTFSVVSFAWIFFRSPNFYRAYEIISALIVVRLHPFSLNAINLSNKEFNKFILFLFVSIFISVFIPNIYDILSKKSCNRLSMACIGGIALTISLWLMTYTEKVSEFLYFQF